MRRITRLVWLFPLLILVSASVLYFVGGAEITHDQLRRELAQTYGVSEATVEAYYSRLPADWKVGDPLSLVRQAHDHAFPANLSSVQAINYLKAFG